MPSLFFIKYPLIFNLHFPINFTPFPPFFPENFPPFPTHILLSAFPLFKHISQVQNYYYLYFTLQAIFILLYKLKHDLKMSTTNMWISNFKVPYQMDIHVR